MTKETKVQQLDELMKFATGHCQENEFDPDRSMKGDNAFYHHCDAYAGRPSYAVCLYKLHAVDESRLHADDSCSKVIGINQCPAVAMREQERQAGRALYFIDRNLQRAEIDAQMSQTMRDLRMRPGYDEGRPLAPPKKRPGMQLDIRPASKEAASQFETPGLRIEGDSLLQKAINNRVKKEMDNASDGR